MNNSWTTSVNKPKCTDPIATQTGFLWQPMRKSDCQSWNVISCLHMNKYSQISGFFCGEIWWWINIIWQNCVLSTELYTVEKVQEPRLALCLALIKWADHIEFNEDIPVSTKGNPITTVFVELFQVSNSILFRKFFGKTLQTEFYFLPNNKVWFDAQGKFDQITGKVKKNKLQFTWNP